MKRLIPVFILLLSLSQALSAATFTYKCNGEEAPAHWWAAGLGGTPILSALTGYTSNYIGYDPMLSSIYSEYRGPIYTTGNLWGEYGWNLFRAFSVSVSAAFTPYWTGFYDGYSFEKTRNAFSCTFWAVCEARLVYVNRPKFRFFSSLDLGIGAGIATGPDQGSDASMIIQFNPIGMEFGDKWFGRLQLGVGVEHMGAQIGFGHRF